MTHRFLISVAAAALLAGTGMANAQGTMGRDAGGAGAQPAQQHAQPSTGGAAEHGSATGKHEKGTVGQAGGSGTMKPGAADEKSEKSGAMKNEHSGAMNKNQSVEDKAGATKGQRSDERAQGPQEKSKSMSSDNMSKSGKDKDMKAEGRSGPANTNNAENRENRQGTSTDMKAEGKTGASSSTVGQAGAGAKLSTEQRTQITSVIRSERVAPATHVNFSIAVGTRVPHEGIELHTLPSRVVTIYPEWRSYKYILVRDEIVIIDPNTYEIVAVLNA